MSKRPVSQLDTFGLVTPSPIAKNARVVSSDTTKKQNGDQRVVNAQRALEFGTADLPATQEPCYNQETTMGLPVSSGTCYGTLKDVYDKSFTFDITKDTIGIGRLPSMDLQIEPNMVYISRKHCELSIDGDEFSSNTASLLAVKSCWVCYPHHESWEHVAAGNHFTLVSGSHLRLVKPGSNPSAKQPRHEFQLQIHALPPRWEPPNAGTHSFDCQYLKLLKAIKEEGEEQKNKKGPNLTLQRSFELEIDLFNEKGLYLLPMTSLRRMGSGKFPNMEALWMLLGEDNVRFLQKNGCKFWDKQCGEDGFVGLNYGLLTNFPRSDGGLGCNQLEEKVINVLCKLGSQSRNMVCTLLKPDESTVQVSCTAGIQFSVNKREKKECLNLTVTQRSSDTMLGLPNDVIVWSDILHFVCREVYIRTNGERNLFAGTLYFHINAGGAHIYSMNMEEAEQILKREPIKECQPRLNILGHECNKGIPLSENIESMGMFELAKDYTLLARVQKEYSGMLKTKGTLVSVNGYDKANCHPTIRINQAV